MRDAAITAAVGRNSRDVFKTFGTDAIAAATLPGISRTDIELVDAGARLEPRRLIFIGPVIDRATLEARVSAAYA